MAFFAMPAIYGQIKIGDNPQAISPTSVLELESSDRVLVITRINTAQMNAIVPNPGAMVYNTDSQCIHYFNGGEWINLCNSAGLEFTTDPIENDISTIVITDQAGTKNFEVAPNSIGSLQIINGGINGVDIQNGSIGQGKLQDDSVTQDKLSENSVGPEQLDNANIDLGDFSNGPGFITGADIVSGDAGNNIVVGGDNGAFYDNQPVLDAIGTNTTAIQNHITADADTNANNEIQTLSFNAGANQLTLTNPSGDNVITLPGGGNPTDELQDLNFNGATNILTLTNPSTAGNQVDLSALAGGGNQNLDQVLTQGNDAGAAQISNLADPTLAQDAATKAYVDANIGGNQNLAQVLAQGTDGGAALIKNILDPVDPQDAATRAFVIATVASGGTLTDGSILIGGAGDVAQQLAISGDATLANDGTLTIGNDVIETGNILNATILAEDLNAMGATADGDNIQWNTTLNAGAGGWEVVASGGGLENEQDIALDITTNSIDLLEDDGATISSSVLLDGTTVEAINNGTDDVIQIADDAITLDKIADNAANDGDVMRWDDTAGEWIVEAAPGEHSGSLMSLFYADATTGLPTTAFNSNNGDIDTAPSLIWDQSKRTNSGALGIGIDGGPFSDEVKVHISEDIPGGLALPLQIQNRIVSNAGDRGVGILFSTERQFAYGKGALVYERLQGFAKGDFHFLQDDDDDTTNPEFTDKAFTIKNNSDITVYGGIDIDGARDGLLTGTGLGTAGQVLSSTGTGVQWITGGAGETNTASNVGTAGEGLFFQKTGVNLEFKNINGLDTNIITVTDDVVNNEIDLDIRVESIDATTKIAPAAPITPTNVDQMLITEEATGDVIWQAVPTGTGNLATTNLTQATATRTYELTNATDNLIFTGLGNVGIGNGANPPANKLHVAGAIRAEGVLNSPGDVLIPSYRFSDDPNTGMFSDAADELGFSVGGNEALRLDEPSVGNTNVIINQSLELSGVLLDGAGNPGAVGEVLTSTNTGTDWQAPASPFHAIAKMNEDAAVNEQNIQTVNDLGAGNYEVVFTTPATSVNYVIQLTLLDGGAGSTIEVTSQTVGGFTVQISDTLGATDADWYFTVVDF